MRKKDWKGENIIENVLTSQYMSKAFDYKLKKKYKRNNSSYSLSSRQFNTIQQLRILALTIPNILSSLTCKTNNKKEISLSFYF